MAQKNRVPSAKNMTGAPRPNVSGGELDLELNPSFDPRVRYPEYWHEFETKQTSADISKAQIRRFFGISQDTEARSDAEILTDIKNRLTDDLHLDVSHLDIKVESGHLSIHGEVDDYLIKRQAEDLCETVLGVRSIENLLRAEHTTA